MNTDSNNQTPKANELPNYYGESHGSIEHSLPSYSNATAASASALKDIPDKKIKNNEDDGDIIDRKFYLCSKHGSYEVTSFVSQDSREKYDLFKSSKSGTDTYSHALYLQRNGYAIPLLTTDHHTIASMHSIKYMSIYKFTPPPATEDRLFNLKKDRFKYCEITRERFKSYYKYEFQFTPDPTDKSKNFSIFMFHHNRYLIADLTPYKGKRLRWVGGDVFDFKVSYQYELHLLSNNQESLTDNLDSKKEVSKENTLLGKTLKNIVFVSQGKKAGEFKGKQIAKLFSPSVRFASPIFDSPAQLEFPETVQLPNDQIKSECTTTVSQESLVYLCMSSVFKRLEDTTESAYRNTMSSKDLGK